MNRVFFSAFSGPEFGDFEGILGDELRQPFLGFGVVMDMHDTSSIRIQEPLGIHLFLSPSKFSDLASY